MPWSGAPQTGYAVDVVDAFLKADKRLEGEARWSPGNRAEEQRAMWPVSVNGELFGAALNVTAYPIYPTQRFKISLNLPPCVWRIDFEPNEKRHTNPLWFGARSGHYVVRGRSYHGWADNRSTALTLAKLPSNFRLECALPLPTELRGFDAAFPWFCQQTMIQFTNRQLLSYPPREKLV